MKIINEWITVLVLSALMIGTVFYASRKQERTTAAAAAAVTEAEAEEEETAQAPGPVRYAAPKSIDSAAWARASGIYEVVGEDEEYPHTLEMTWLGTFEAYDADGSIITGGIIQYEEDEKRYCLYDARGELWDSFPDTGEEEVTRIVLDSSDGLVYEAVSGKKDDNSYGFDVDISGRERYTEEELQEGVEAVMTALSVLEGYEMQRLSFSEEKSAQALELIQEKKPEAGCTEGMVFESQLRAADGEYAWDWYLGRTAGEEWQVLWYGE